MGRILDRILNRRDVLSEQSYPLPKGPNTPAGAIANDWGHLIWGYVTNLFGTSGDYNRYDRVRKEISDRGLAFGQIKVRDSNDRVVNLGLLGDQKITLELVEDVLKTVLKEKELDTKLEVRMYPTRSKLEVICLTDDLPGRSWTGYRDDGEPFSYKEFLTIWGWGGTDGLRTMEALSDEATCVLVRVAEILGFPAGPKHYAHESPIKIEDIVVYAARWEDPQSGCRYLDILWRRVFVRHQVWHGSNRSDKRMEGDFEGEVLACTSRADDWWPKMTINNRPVYSTIVQTPTAPMLKAREKFKRESIRECGVCGDMAVQEVTLVRFEVEDGLGSSSMGGITYACEKEICLEEVKKTPCVRSEVRPYEQENWG